MHAQVSQTRTCIINYSSKKATFDKEIYNQSHNFYHFIKDLCTLSRGPDIEPLSCQNLIGVGCAKGGRAVMMLLLFFIILFFEVRAKTPKSFSCLWKNIFIDSISNTNIFQVAH